jgi:hypothetical protein
MFSPPRLPSAPAGLNTRFHLQLALRMGPLNLPLIVPVIRTTNGVGARL